MYPVCAETAVDFCQALIGRSQRDFSDSDTSACASLSLNFVDANLVSKSSSNCRVITRLPTRPVMIAWAELGSIKWFSLSFG